MEALPSELALERLKGLHPTVIDLALDRIERLLAALDHPERQLPPVVHVAGTNGKGSTVAFLRAMAEAAGRRVHVYTSPHLVRFAERIRLAGQLIGEEQLTALLLECEARNGGQSITFFEATTAVALLAFARQPADLCLLETGLGGRVDATNVVGRPILTVLTSISLDHQAFLGTDVAAIAGEKAGILKPGVPCVCARQEPPALAVIEARARVGGAPLLVEGRDWAVTGTAEGLRFVAEGEAGIDFPSPALLGPHQIHNAGVALAAARYLGLPQSAQAEGLRRAEWPARLQRLTQGPLVAALPDGWELWLDGGHNPGAGVVLAEHVAGHWSDRPLHLVVGMLDSKDSKGFLDPLAPLTQSFRGIAIAGEPHSFSAEAVSEAARAAGLKGHPAADLAASVTSLAGEAGPARILICGSLYLAGRVLAENG